ncbi:MAG: hypothetical protein HY695_10280 [Deltaproteobacteria bacterium]|nr:hypothetical protein [Deltaproteobacteria bacterium]
MSSTDTGTILNVHGPVNQEAYAKAIFNILEDFTAEKGLLEETQRAILNILEDFAGEKDRLEETQRAMLNLLEDFYVERSKTETANHELRESFESLRLAKEATEAANREIEAFSYSVSHDLRAPLRSIAGFSQVLLEDYSEKLDEEGQDLLKRVVAAAEKMAWLIDDLLKLSRVSRAPMEREQVDMSMAARKIAARLSASAPARQVEFILAESLLAFGDGRLLTVALENLLGNAWKFTKKRQQAVIEFGAALRGDKMIFFIKDNGAGFDMTYSGKLFQPFQRLHGAEEFSGTGIGLATVKRIIERHGGRVWIEGELGKGTTVHFTLEERETISHAGDP